MLTSSLSWPGQSAKQWPLPRWNLEPDPNQSHLHLCRKEEDSSLPGKERTQMGQSAQRPPMGLPALCGALPVGSSQLKDPQSTAESSESHPHEGHLCKGGWQPGLCPPIQSFLRVPFLLSQSKMRASHKATGPVKTRCQQPSTPRGPQAAPLPKVEARGEGALPWKKPSQDPC